MNRFNELTERDSPTRLLARLWAALVSLSVSLALAGSASAQGACDATTCDTLASSLCDAGGFKVSLVGFEPASTATSGVATYTYEICSPEPGVCSGDGTTACRDNNKCTQGGNPAGGTCNRECAVDQFRDLSHLDLFFPELGGAESCLSDQNTVSGSCAVSTNSSGQASVGSFVLGDGSLESICGFPDPNNDNNRSIVAKCDETNLAPGDCMTMTLTIAGETNGLGLGRTMVLSKESTDCNESCIAGPSCECCDPDGCTPGGDACLTRTIGFWGTHPWITNDHAPVTVCGVELGCGGAASLTSDPSCPAGTCDSIIEGLCSVGGEDKRGAAYIAMVNQLTAAKLNLNASATLVNGGCSGFSYDGQSIQWWIDICENGYCQGRDSAISRSGCIEALDAFNNSEDVGFEVTPSPFDRPPVDDFGNISGADPGPCHEARGTGGDPALVIGKDPRPAVRRHEAIDCAP